MKALFILEYFPPHIGGVETLFDNLTRKLAERGNDVTVLTSRVPGAPSYEESAGRKIHRISAASRTAFILSSHKIAKFAKEADVIHTTTYAGALATKLANRSAKKPVVATFHEVIGKAFFSMENPVSAAFHYFLESLICRYYKRDTLTCPSEATKHAMIIKGMNPENIHVIQHGIDHTVFNASVRPLRGWDGPTYLCFGRPGVSKGIEYLVRAVPQITEAVPDAKLVLMLSRNERYSKIISEVRKLGVERNVTFLQPQTRPADVAGVIKSCDITVVPSISEGFGFNAVEAQACGVPVVASDTASLPEVVKGGVLVEPRNPAKIAEAVIMLLKDRAMREKLGKAGAEHAKKYTWEKATDSYLKLYESVLNG